MMNYAADNISKSSVCDVRGGFECFGMWYHCISHFLSLSPSPLPPHPHTHTHTGLSNKPSPLSDTKSILYAFNLMADDTFLNFI